jgi:hypothetical protein
MTRLAIVTGEDAPDLTDDGQRLAAALGTHGVDAAAARWDDPSVDWGRFDAALVRLCWEYYRDLERFLRLLERLEAADVTVRNPPEVVRWNVHKSYLRDLAGAGVRVVPTEYVGPDEDADLATILAERGWDEAVVKPPVGTSSAGVWRTSRETATADQSRFERPFDASRRVGDSASKDGSETLPNQGALVQEFYPEVAGGERSLVFFAGEFSHAWESLRADDAIGVEPTATPAGAFTPDEETRATAAGALDVAAEVLDIDASAFTYARVDGVHRGGAFHLLELELVEPYLDLGAREGAVETFADAVARAVAGGE